MYNSYYQVVQSPGYVMILVEMVHAARIIRIDDKHVLPSILSGARQEEKAVAAKE